MSAPACQLPKAAGLLSASSDHLTVLGRAPEKGGKRPVGREKISACNERCGNANNPFEGQKNKKQEFGMVEELVFKDEAAAEYDRAFAHVTAHFMPFLLRAAHLAPGMRVLDIATGTGLSAEAAL